MEKNFYEILGVSQDTSCAEIEMIFTDSVDTLKGEAKEAYSVLTNINSRMAYDKWLNAEESVRYNYVTGEFYEAPTEQQLADEEKKYNLLFLNKEAVQRVLHNEQQYDLEQVFTAEENKERLDYADKVAYYKEVRENSALQNQLASDVKEIMDEDTKTTELAVIEEIIDPEIVKDLDEMYIIEENNEEVIEEPVKEEKKGLKKTLKIALYTLATAIAITGATHILKACGKNNNKGNDVHTVVTPTTTPVQPTATVAPTATVVPTATPTVAPTATPTPTPIIPEEVTELNSENIDVVANYIVEQNKAKGLEVNVEDVKAALVFANVGSINKDELKEMTQETNSEEEYNKANNYFVAVQSHNIKNAILGKDMNNYVALSDICYTENDKHVLQSLDAYSVWVNECNNRDILTSEDYQSSFKNIMNFYFEIGKGLIVGEERYPYAELTAGGKFVAEMMSPNFTIPYTLSKHATQENRDFISSLENRIIDGVEYLNEMFDIYEGEKVLTK